MMARKRTRKDIGNLLTEQDSQAAGFFPQEVAPTPARAARVIMIPLGQCMPDRFQSRIILPPEIKRRFFAGQIDCYQAAEELLAETAFEGSGLERQVASLLELGENIQEFGQIEPATGSWIEASDGQLVFALEVGERRFWSLALTAVRDGLDDEPQLKVIEESHFSRERQISENIQREGNTAVDLARAIAGLILMQMDILPDLGVDDDEAYFRQILSIKRFPNGTWNPIEKIVGKSRPTLERHLKILQLPSRLLYEAKLHDLPESRLREILMAPPENYEQLIRFAIEENTTARDLREIVENLPPVEKQSRSVSPGRRPKANIHQKAASRVRSFWRLARRRDFDFDYEAVAVELSISTDDADDLLELADHLEAQSDWLRKIHERRME
jgi:DNA-binding transcriptional ArsR family regulator